MASTEASRGQSAPLVRTEGTRKGYLSDCAAHTTQAWVGEWVTDMTCSPLNSTSEMWRTCNHVRTCKAKAMTPL